MERRTLKRRLPGLIVFCLLLTSCIPTPAPAVDSGVEGYVTIGPTCPVLQLDNPCPDKPYQANLSILNTDGMKILVFQTNADGFFRVPLASGRYLLRPVTSGKYPITADQPFIVLAGQYTRLSITFDSGIR